MMSLSFAFWMYVFIFSIIGLMRGWAKELLVTFSVVLTLFFHEVLGRYVPPVRDFFAPPNGTPEFWLRMLLLLAMIMFGYQTPNLPKLDRARFVRERLSDSLLGFFLGALNGFLIVGTVWFFLEQSNYPFPSITRPTPAPALLSYLPPEMLGIPVIYFAVALAFLFVLVVFI